MSEIKRKVMKEVEEVVDHKCDICGNIIAREYEHRVNDCYYLNTIKYFIGWGDLKTHELHVCSKNCFIKALKEIISFTYDCDIHLNSKLIKELIE